MSNWLSEQNDQRSDYKEVKDPFKKKKFYDILCSKYLKSYVFFTVFVLVVPIGVYYFVVDRGSYPISSTATCMIVNNFRVSCGRDKWKKVECLKHHCCFDSSNNECYHSLPSFYSYVKTGDSNVYEASMKKSPLNTNCMKQVALVVNEKTENVVRIKLEVFDKNKTIEKGSVIENKNYEVIVEQNTLSVDILRKGSKEPLLSTSKGPLIFSENYTEWTLYLSNGTLFGFNQTLISLRKDETFRKVLYKGRSDHYSEPIFWVYTKKKFHGVSIFHEGPLEIIVLSSNLVILRSLITDNIEVEVYLGTTPKDLHNQLVKTITVPQSWTMEPHVCR